MVLKNTKMIVLQFKDEKTAFKINLEDEAKVLAAILKDLEQQKAQGVKMPAEGEVLVRAIPLVNVSEQKLRYKLSKETEISFDGAVNSNGTIVIELV